jgi:putative ABC transport system permease protein
MVLTDLIGETFTSLLSNKSRSALTILGIVIGIASVITMVSIGQGSTKDIESNIQALGSNLLVVSPGAQRSFGTMVRSSAGSASTLTEEDAATIEQSVENLKAVSSLVSTSQQVIYKGNNTRVSVYGIDGAYQSMKSLEADLGSFLSAEQISNGSKVAVLGPTVRDDLFGEDVDPVGKKIKIGSQQFTVIGITKAKGSSGMNSADSMIYVPLSVVEHYFTGNESLSAINIEVVSDKLMTQAEDDIFNLLLARHKISSADAADFSIMNQADIMETMSSVSGTLTLLLGAVAGISLIVGGIGIMNMMLTTVTERTREIGLRKSLGARRTDIGNQFLLESITLTFIGGTVGILLGIAASVIIDKFGGTTTVISAWSVVLSFFVSTAIGIIFGYYPARKASTLNPIEALRYE